MPKGPKRMAKRGKTGASAKRLEKAIAKQRRQQAKLIVKILRLFSQGVAPHGINSMKAHSKMIRKIIQLATTDALNSAEIRSTKVRSQLHKLTQEVVAGKIDAAGLQAQINTLEKIYPGKLKRFAIIYAEKCEEYVRRIDEAEDKMSKRN